jgi:periplasmic mercuric ion binding protein
MKTKIRIEYLVLITCLLLTSTLGFSQDKKTATIKIRTSAVCSQCKDRIEQGMAYAKGVRDITLDVDSKIATVKYSTAKTSPAEIRKGIAKLGYDADDIPADKAAYKKLPPCCKKDAEKH